MGDYSLREVLTFTYELYSSRFRNMRRDVLKKVYYRCQRRYDERGKLKGERFLFTTYSYPQYYPYTKEKRGRVQRTIRHEYDITLNLGELCMNTRDWTLRVGSFRKWVPKVPAKYIRSKKNPKGVYLSVGDWNADVLGLNGDFYFRQATPLYVHGHLFGRLWEQHNEGGVPFFGKHDLRMLEVLIDKKLIRVS